MSFDKYPSALTITASCPRQEACLSSSLSSTPYCSHEAPSPPLRLDLLCENIIAQSPITCIPMCPCIDRNAIDLFERTLTAVC